MWALYLPEQQAHQQAEQLLQGVAILEPVLQERQAVEGCICSAGLVAPVAGHGLQQPLRQHPASQRSSECWLAHDGAPMRFAVCWLNMQH